MDLVSFPSPKNVGTLTNYNLLTGLSIPPIDRMKVFSAEQFEDFVREWGVGFLMKNKRYVEVKKCSGAGDMGRDVIGVLSEDQYDNYQCKHYDTPLAPTDIYLEVGKLIYYTNKGEYSLPRKYYFISPQGIGAKLNNFFENSTKFKEELFLNWDKYCKASITSTGDVILDRRMKKYIEELDFKIFKGYDPQQLIEEHRTTAYFAARFGGGLQKKRNKRVTLPNTIEPNESVYTSQLFEAYSDFSGKKISKREDLFFNNELVLHFDRQRESFYSAEALNQFSRDSISPGIDYFQDLKSEFYRGVIDVVNEDYPDGYRRVRATTNFAKILQIDSSPLIPELCIIDREGICHHLANEEKLLWVRK